MRIDPHHAGEHALRYHSNRIARKAVTSVLAGLQAELPTETEFLFYGPTGLDPAQLAIWYVFGDAVALETAQDVGLWEQLRERTQAALLAGGYQADAVPKLFIGFTSADGLDPQLQYWR
jgi:hypothetical protein